MCCSIFVISDIKFCTWIQNVNRYLNQNKVIINNHIVNTLIKYKLLLEFLHFVVPNSLMNGGHERFECARHKLTRNCTLSFCHISNKMSVYGIFIPTNLCFVLLHETLEETLEQMLCWCFPAFWEKPVGTCLETNGQLQNVQQTNGRFKP